MTSDAIAYAIVLDAINHPGPADPARIDRGRCADTTLPGAERILLERKR